MKQMMDIRNNRPEDNNPFRIEVAAKDHPEPLTWFEAMNTYDGSTAKNGWRLPTRLELLWMYENRTRLGGFDDDYYWSSSAYDSTNAWYQYFTIGYQYPNNKHNYNRVRPVLDFSPEKRLNRLEECLESEKEMNDILLFLKRLN